MFLKSVLFSQAEKLINIGKFRVIQASDHLSLDPELNPRAIPWNEAAVNWEDKKSFLISLFKIFD